MRTNKAPWDYESPSPAILIDALIKLCPLDGGYVVALPPDGSCRCLICNGTAFDIILLSQAAVYREEISSNGHIKIDFPIQPENI